MMRRSHRATGDVPLRMVAARLVGPAGGRACRSRRCPYRRRVRGWLYRRLRAPDLRTGPRGGDGGGRAVGRIPRPAGDLAVADRLPAGDGVRRRSRNPWRCASRRRDRHRGLGRRARPDGGAGGPAAALDRGGAGRRVRDLPRPCPWRRASARRRCARLFGRLRGRDRPLAPRRPQLWPALSMAGRTTGGAPGRRRHCARRLRVPAWNHMSGILWAALLVVLSLHAGTAQAASPAALGGAFWQGLLQPLLNPPHALSLLALGLLFGRHGRAAWQFLAVFAVAMAAGLTAIALAVGATPAVDILLANAAVAGLLVALQSPLRNWLGWLRSE